MFYTIYKTTNLINGKFYIGKHKTKDLNDGYFGSGKYLIRAINKYGIENFVTEIVEVFETEHEANLAEKILVVLDSEISYNLCKGGMGGFSFINSKGLTRKFTQEDLLKASKNRRPLPKERQLEVNKKLSIITHNFYYNSDKGAEIRLAHSKRTHLNLNSPQAIYKRGVTFKQRGHAQGPKNSQYGKRKSEETLVKLGSKMKQAWDNLSSEQKQARLAALDFARRQRKCIKDKFSAQTRM